MNSKLINIILLVTAISLSIDLKAQFEKKEFYSYPRYDGINNTIILKWKMKASTVGDSICIQRNNGVGFVNIKTGLPVTTVQYFDNTIIPQKIYIYRALFFKNGIATDTTFSSTSILSIQWPLADKSYNVCSAFGDITPANHWMYHEGVDFLAKDKDIEIIRSGELAYYGNSGSPQVYAIVKVDIGGGKYEYDLYNHIADTVIISGKRSLYAGENIGTVDTLTYHATNLHLHLTRMNAIDITSLYLGIKDPNGENLENPLEVFNNVLYNDIVPTPTDPYNQAPVIGNPQYNKSNAYQKFATKNNLYNSVDISVSLTDYMTDVYTTAKFPSVNQAGYYIKSVSGGGADVQNTTSPYTTFKYDNNWFNDPAHPITGTFIVNGAFLSKHTFVDVTKPSTFISTLGGGVSKYYKSYILTNCKGTQGLIADADSLQFWNTRAKSGTFSQANGSDAAQSSHCNEESAFKDGKYIVHILAKDLINSTEKTDTVTIDNFLPFIKQITIKRNNVSGQTVYNSSWNLTASTYNLVQNTIDSISAFENIFVEITTSEPVKWCGLQIPTTTFSNINHLAVTGSDDTKWQFTIPGSVNFGKHKLQITASDLAGNALLLEIPKMPSRNSDLTFDPVVNVGTDTLHYFYIKKLIPEFSINDKTNFSTMSLIDTANYTFKDISQGTPTAWNWKISKQKPGGIYIDTTSYNTKTFQFRFKRSGTYKISLSVNYGSATHYSVSHVVNVICPGSQKSGETCVEADFYAHKTLILDNQTAQFEDLSTPGITSWNWTFEGGTPATFSGKTPPPVNYLISGTYDVTLTASNGTNTDTYTKTDYITVSHLLVTDIVVPTIGFPTIQSGIDYVKNHNIQNGIVWVKPGIYRENINFKGTKNIKVIGDEQNPANTIIDGSGLGNTVAFVNYEDLTTELSGFTVQNTDTAGNTLIGRGILIGYASPKLKNLIIQKNNFGASSAKILDYLEKEVFKSHEALENSKIYKTLFDITNPTQGAGIFAFNTAFELSNCMIKNNGNPAIGNRGGGIYLTDASPLIYDSEFSTNNANTGGGLFINQSICNFKNVVVKNNFSARGAGIFTTASLETNSDLQIINNTASVEIGGIYSIGNAYKNIVLSGNSPENMYISDTNASVENITSVNSNIGLVITGNGALVKNSVITGNSLYDIKIYTNTNISYSNINKAVSFNGDLNWGSGNINSDPQFIAAKSGNYYLKPTSPCINRGNPDAGFNDNDQTRNDMGACRSNITGIIDGNSSVCANSVSNFSIDACPDYNFNWKVSNSAAIIGGQGTKQISVRLGANPGNVAVTVSTANQTVVSKPFAYTVNKVPAQPGEISGETTPCIKSSANYTVSPVNNATGYLWTFPVGWNFSGNSNSVTATVGSNSGQISVTPYNQCGNGLPASLNVYAATAISGPTVIKLSATNSAAYFVKNNSQLQLSYQWTVPTGWTIISGQGTAGIRVTAGVSGFVTVQIFNSVSLPTYFCPLYVTVSNSIENPDLAETDSPFVNFDFSIFPNPSSNIVNILINSGKEISQELSIYNITGNIVKTIDLKTRVLENNTLTVDISDFVSGVYLFTLKTDKNRYFSKIIKE
jgi:PKD repeat protein